ncbi:unnamed protein product [Adineta ricciae]|nr:unnamed protein product [Adineta ricciae]
MANNIDTSSKSLNSRIEELKQSLMPWRHILLPLNDLLRWRHKQHPFVIFGSITLIYLFISQTNPSVLTFISCFVLILVLLDFLAPISISLLFKNEKWTSMHDTQYAELCKQIANLEQFLRSKYQLVLQIREEQPTMYLIVGGICLGFVALCCQHFDNLFLSYSITLIICLLPGICHRTDLFNQILETN